MAFKMTRTTIKANYSNIYYVGYCEMYHALGAFRKIGWTEGVYGWNYNVYEIDNETVVLTGYRGMFGTRIDHDLSRKIEAKADKIYCDRENRLPYEKRKAKIRRMVLKYFETIKEGGV